MRPWGNTRATVLGMADEHEFILGQRDGLVVVAGQAGGADNGQLHQFVIQQLQDVVAFFFDEIQLDLGIFLPELQQFFVQAVLGEDGMVPTIREVCSSCR